MEEDESALAYASELAAPSSARPITKERLQKLHELTHHTLSVSQLRALLRRARVPNVAQALKWYQEIVAKCGCSLAEYQHRHRVPRLHLRDQPFNEEVEMDVMKLGGHFWLVAVCRGTLLPMVLRMPNRSAKAVRDAFMRMWVLLHGAPARGISDCGGEFLSREFLESTDLFAICKEATPAYASDRHGAVERLIRTIREAAERALRGSQHRLTLAELDIVVAIIVNEATNDLQPCGTSAAQRAYGRATSPFLSLLQHPVVPAPSRLALIQEEARNRWREVANDRKFQQLLKLQLGPQAHSAANPPVHGSLVYYRRPSPTDDGRVFRGPAVVIGTDHATEQAFLTHGGLLVRAAYEHLRPAPGQALRKDSKGVSEEHPPGRPAAQFEELDERDGPPAEPPAAYPAVIPIPQPVVESGTSHSTGSALEPASPGSGCGSPVAHASGGTAVADVPDEVIDIDTATPDAEPHPAPLAEPAVSAAAASPVAGVSGGDVSSPLPTHLHDVDEPSPEHSLAMTPGGALHEWYDDEPTGEEVFPVGEASVFEMDDEDMPVELDTAPVVDALSPEPGSPDADDEPQPHFGLELNEVIAVKTGPRKWSVGRVFSLEERVDRVSVAWEGARAADARFATLNLAEEEWRRVPRSSRLNPALWASGGETELANDVVSPILAAIAALEARIEAGGGGVQQPTNEESAHELPEGKRDRSMPRSEGLLCAMVAHASKQRLSQPASEDAMPATLTTFAAEAIEKMLGTLPKEPTREELEQCGVALADAFRGHLFVAVFEYLDRDAMHLMSDEQALGVLRLLGERYAAPDASWTDALRNAFVALRGDDVSPKALGEALVVVEHGLAKLDGRETASVPAFAAQVTSQNVPESLSKTPEGVRDTAVYKYTDADLTPEMRLEGAKAEVQQWEDYEVFADPDAFRGEDLPDDAIVIDSKYFDKPKVKNGKLIAKGRMTPKGFQDPERWMYRNDSPTASRTSLYLLIVIAIAMSWSISKIDITGAFLNGDPLERKNLWIKYPKELIAMGLLGADGKVFRRLAKAAYGLNQAPRQWYLKLARVLEEIGFVKSLLDPCIFLLQEGGKVVAAVLIYVDDLILAGEADKITTLEAQIGDRLPIGTIERSTEVDGFSFTGKDIEFVKDESGAVIAANVNQTAYVESQVKDEDCEFDAEKRSAQALITPKEVDWYRAGLGKLGWTGNTRPDLAVDHSELSAPASCPTVGDAKRLAKVLRILKSTAKQGLHFPKMDLESLQQFVFADGSWANAGDRTQGGHMIFLADKASKGKLGQQPAALLSWVSASLKRVCTSTYDAETLSLLRATDESIAIALLFTELTSGRLPSLTEQVLLRGFGHKECVPRSRIGTVAYSDGESVVSNIHTSKAQIRNKRRRVDVASLREASDDGVVVFEHVPTDLMVADGTTKKDDKLRSVIRIAMDGRVHLP